MKWILFIAAILVGNVAHADADYPVYRCDGPWLDMVSPGGLSPQDVKDQFPELPDPERLEFYILQDGDTVSWTDLTRDEMREMCINRVDRANAPRSGLWTLSLDPLHQTECMPPPIDAMIGSFPRRLTFGDVFRPRDILNIETVNWKIDRYPEDLLWSAYGGAREGVTDLRAMAVTFLEVAPQSIEIDLYFETTDLCRENYTVMLQLDEY